MKPKRTSACSFCTRPPCASSASCNTRHRDCAPPAGYLLSDMLPDSSTSNTTVGMIFSKPTLMSLQPGMCPEPPSTWKTGGAVADPELPAIELDPDAADGKPPPPPADVGVPPAPE